jgi:AAA-like domain
MLQHFNTAGPVNAADHYALPLLARMDWSGIRELIEAHKYFVLHAPRQTGKTSTLLAMMDELNASGDMVALYANIEAAQADRGDIAGGLRTITTQIAEQASLYLGDERLRGWAQDMLAQNGPSSALTALLARWARETPKPTVLLLDEVDALVGDTLISLLRQIRAGYAQRPGAFPQSIVLCGVRDVRDYRIHTGHNEIITGGSAFNIKAESLRMDNFSEADVHTLYAQHTAATGQVFEPEALSLAWAYTHGQPWLVNALAYECTHRMKPMRDRALPVTGEVMRQAKENLILSRATHLDALIDKLREDRIRRVIQPMLQGETTLSTFTPDDVQYTYDMGLIRRQDKVWVIANAIYAEIIPRELTADAQDAMYTLQSWYLDTDAATGDTHLNLPRLLGAFQQFFRENAEHWLERFAYREAGPQLLLQAYLQRIVNGGGRIEREYGLGRGRTDLFVTWPTGVQPRQRIVLELKVKRVKDGLDAVIAEGLVQTQSYMQRCGATEGHLLVFDANPQTAWDDKIYTRVLTDNITLWGA